MPLALVVRRLAFTGLALCFLVVVLGAYVRLSAAGLACPDWPGCYGAPTPAGIAPAAAADQNFSAAISGTLEQHRVGARRGGEYRRHGPCGACPDHDDARHERAKSSGAAAKRERVKGRRTDAALRALER